MPDVAEINPAGEAYIKEKQPDDEVVDVKVEITDGGEMRIEFASHGRVHKLNLRESRQLLCAIY